MAKIIQLPEHVISKIAAGEVIERPVYAVKELVENAIDAGASSIIIHIEQSGLRTITVIDDGEGMSPEDLELSVRHHTTSKLTDEAMLSQISTLGFRGEALSSIAAISDLTVCTKRESDTIGTKIETHDGKIESILPIGLPRGTHVTISNLFSTVPARKKFLKSEKTEFRLICDLITQYALAFPHIRFVLTHNGKQVFDLPQTKQLTERLALLFPKEIFESFIPVTYADSYTTISGFLAKPQFASSSTQKQYLFVNTRRVSDKLLSISVKDAFGTMLEQTAYPVFVLFLSMPYELVDVNVHPRKEQVRFVNTQLIYDAVRKATGESLAEQNITFVSTLFSNTSGEFATKKSGSTKTYAASLLKEDVIAWDMRPLEKILTVDVLQIHKLYILCQTTHGFVLLDQHAAHERILYEQYQEEFLKKKKSSMTFPLAEPIQFEFSLSDAQLLKEYEAMFAEIGITFEHFGGNSYLLTTVPLLLRDRDHKTFVLELLDDVRDEKGIKRIDVITQRMLSYLACRSAIMAGEHLTKKQMKELLEKLEETPNNATCPHGRPTKISVSLEQLHRVFRRK